MLHDPATETLEHVNIGNLQVIQPKQGYRFSVDALLLADFLTVKPNERLIDLGTGTGIIPLLSSSLHPTCEIVGIEFQERLADMAARNVRLNSLEDRIRILNGDIRFLSEYVKAGTFDVVCSNPPYRKVGAGRRNPEHEQAVARHEIACTLDDLLAGCKYVLHPGGKVFFIYLPERLSELLVGMSKYRLEPKRLRFIHALKETPASLVLVDARRDAQIGLTILPPLYLYKEKNVYSDEASRILREGQKRPCEAGGAFANQESV